MNPFFLLRLYCTYIFLVQDILLRQKILKKIRTPPLPKKINWNVKQTVYFRMEK